MKPKIFIGSSVESLTIAYSVQENLEHNAECTVWNQGIFNLSETSLDSLVKSLEGFDFGIFVVGPEDVLKLRGEEFKAARDNVIFELGLFIGKLGKSRNFILAPRGQQNFHLPTDLLGLTPADYDPNRSDGNLNAALGPACNKILRAIQSLGIINPVQDNSSGQEMASVSQEGPVVSTNSTVVTAYDEARGQFSKQQARVEKRIQAEQGQ